MSVVRRAVCVIWITSFSVYAHAETLRVCLNENLPPASFHRGDTVEGFDVAVAEAVALHLGRALTIQWFGSRLEADKSAALETNALLSDGRCQLAGGYPLVANALEPPRVTTAALPDFEGAKAADRRRRVPVGELRSSHPYRYAPLTVIATRAAAIRKITSLRDLTDIKLGAEGGSFADAILMTFNDGQLVEQIHHVTAGRDELLMSLEKGIYDAALVDLRQFDAYRSRVADTQLKPTGYYYKFGFNRGFVALASDKELMAAVDQAVDTLLARDTLPALANAAGMTYLPPRSPHIAQAVSLADIKN